MRRGATPVRLLLVGVLPGLLCGCVAVGSPSRPTDAADRFGPSAAPGADRPGSALPQEQTPPAAPFVRITAPAAPSHRQRAAVERLDAPGEPPAESPTHEGPRPSAPRRPQRSPAPVADQPQVNAVPGLCDQAERSGQLPSGLGSPCRQMFGR